MYLYKRLQRQANAPSDFPSDLIVGPLRDSRAKLFDLFESVYNGKEPSQLQVVLGPNGNGKTLLCKLLEKVATDKNLRIVDDRIEKMGFEVLFSHVTLNPLDPEFLNTGALSLELAKNLRRSLNESPETTYSTLAVEIINRAVNEYEIHWGWKLVPWISKKFINRLTLGYLSELENLIKSGVSSQVTQSLDTAYSNLQSKLRRRLAKKSITAYAEKNQLGSFLRPFIESSSSKLTIGKLNEELYEYLRQSQALSLPVDTIKALASLTKDVGAKVLLLVIDDCNTREAFRFLLSVADRLDEFKKPRLFIVANAVEEKWNECMAMEKLDRSVEHKLQIYGKPIGVIPPSIDEISQLYDRLESLMNDEIRNEGKFIKSSSKQKNQAINLCKDKSFRVATMNIINSLEACIGRRP